MDFAKLIAIAFLGVVISIILKKEKPEISMMIGIITGITIFLASMYKLGFIIDCVKDLSQKAHINNLYMATILKIVGISYLIEFAIQICKDSNEGAIATKLEFGGKILILAMAFPILLSILNTIIGALP